MIPKVVFANPFLTWVLVSLLLYCGLFWAFYAGILAYIVVSDFTYIALGLLGLFIYCNVSLGIMAARLQWFIDNPGEFTDEDTSLFYPNYDVIGYWAVTAPTLGLIGTVIGLSHLMHDAATVDIDTIVALIGIGSGAALYPTGVGLVMFAVISFQRFLQMHSFRIYDFEGYL